MATLAGISNFHKVPELRRRVIFTLGMLAVYRIGVFVTVPGVDRNVMRQAVAKQSGLLTFFNMFTGGALENFSIFALGIMPYISASIIIQLMGMVYKPVDELRKEGEQGRRKLDQYTRYGTIALSTFQSYGIAKLAESISSSETGGGIVVHPGLGFQLLTVITLTTGTAFLMWIGEQITERGVSNGISTSSRCASRSSWPAWSARSWSSRSSRTAAGRSRSCTRGARWAVASTAGRRRTCRSR
jgi:preprotein translocase subunit SecY